MTTTRARQAADPKDAEAQAASRQAEQPTGAGRATRKAGSATKAATREAKATKGGARTAAKPPARPRKEATKPAPHDPASKPKPATGASHQAYATLMGVFGLGCAAAGLAIARRGAPKGVTAGDLALLGVGTFKLARLLSRDRVTGFLRAPFVEVQGEAPQPNELEEEAKGTGLQRAVGELLTCPHCVGTWVAAGLTGAWALAPGGTRVVLAGLAASTLGDALHLAHTAAWEWENGEEGEKGEESEEGEEKDG